MVGGSAHAEREVGILDGILSLVHSSFTLGSSPTAQQLHVLLHRLTQFIHFLGGKRDSIVAWSPPCPPDPDCPLPKVSAGWVRS